MLDWSEARLPGPILDKHSTGGIGDNVSLMLAPMLAACGAFTPMISGRGLGHTGGTLDKLEFDPRLCRAARLDLFRRTVAEAGCAIIGQTADLAPADKRLYAIRDVTATVESVALITASILSKKLAAGLQGLVMDVKTGSGAFMASLDGARDLARSLATVASGAGLPTVSLITDMNEPLASAAGNAVEVANAVDIPRRREARRAAACGDDCARRRIARARRSRCERRRGARRDGALACERRRRGAVRADGGDARRPERVPAQCGRNTCPPRQ